MAEQKQPEKRHNSKRYREILSVLLKNGLGFVFVKTALSKHPQQELLREDVKHGQGSVAQRLRISCEQLGPTFIKLGQIMSMRADIVPVEFVKELQKLQDNVPAFPFAEARQLIESQLGGSIEEVFAEFDPQPVASASVSQVYRARLRSGDLVAVKVARPGIHEVVETDLSILLKLARFVDRHTKYGKLYHFEGMVRELKKVMEQEMDFVHEGGNIDRFRENLADVANVSAPRVRWVYTTSSVLTMSYVDGIKINNIAELDRIHANKRKIAEDFAGALLHQILVDGFFHADPHPGNVMVADGGTRIEFIDLGMVGTLSEHFRKQLNELILGLAMQNTRKIANAIMDMDMANANVNQRHFMKTLDVLMDEYVYSPLTSLNAGKLFASIFSLAGEYKMIIAGEFALVAKALGTAQGIIEELAPGVSVLSIAKETQAATLGSLFTPKQVEEQLKTALMDGVDIAKQAPPFLLNLMRKMEENDFAVDLNIKQMNKLDKNLERMANRISFTVVLLAVCIVMAGVVIALGLRSTADPAMYELSLFALRAGLLIAVAIVGGLVFNIIYSSIKRH